MTDIKETILKEAGKIVSGARRKAYGKPENNFERIARFWCVYFENTGRPIALTAADVSPMMRLMKEARLCETPDHYDSFVDIIGYTLTGAEVNKVSEIETVPPAVDPKEDNTYHGPIPPLPQNEGNGMYIGLTRDNRIGKPEGKENG